MLGMIDLAHIELVLDEIRELLVVVRGLLEVDRSLALDERPVEGRLVLEQPAAHVSYGFRFFILSQFFDSLGLIMKIDWMVCLQISGRLGHLLLLKRFDILVWVWVLGESRLQLIVADIVLADMTLLQLCRLLVCHD